MPEMFGKRYDWIKVNGVWSLHKGLESFSGTAPVEATPFSYDDFIGFLRRVEAEPLVVSGPISPEMWEELFGNGIGERAGRIPVAGRGHGVQDAQERRDEQERGEVGNGFAHGAMASPQGDREEGAGREADAVLEENGQ